MNRVGRNDPCPCGSGKKFKKCCEEKVTRKKFEATVLSSPSKTTSIGTSFFRKKPLETAPEHQELPPPENEM